MKFIGIDYETYYDNDYSLKKMTPVEYILDPRFECLGMSVREQFAADPYWVDGEDVQRWFDEADRNVLMYSHNALFDMCIANWRFGYVPNLMACTLAMMRAIAKHKLGLLPSLAKSAKFLGLEDKGGFIAQMRGMRLRDLKADPNLYNGMVGYAIQDIVLASQIFNILVFKTNMFPKRELVVLDNVLRAAVVPKFRLNRQVLVEHLAEVKASKEQLLIQAGVADKSELMSNNRFAELLQNLGVDPPTKISAVTGKRSWAFAKQDLGFLELETHPDPVVQALFAARLGNKSTIEESRTERFITVCDARWPRGQHQVMPIPLRYSAAHTHRLGGDWKLNPQNMGRKSRLREALTCADDEIIIAADSSQVEARLVATVCGAALLRDQFAAGEDVYSSFASLIFGFKVDKKANPTERFVGKQGVLGLGYGLGWVNFQRRIQIDSKNQIGTIVVLDDGQSQHVVNTYRQTYKEVPQAWNDLGNYGIRTLVNGGTWDFGPVQVEKGAIRLPNGMYLRYSDLKYEDGEWTYDSGYEGRKKIYGGKLLENIIQAIARIITMEVGSRVRKLTGETWALQAHDELVYVIKADKAQAFKEVLMAEMVRRPEWLPDVPLAAECGEGKTYADAK